MAPIKLRQRSVDCQFVGYLLRSLVADVFRRKIQFFFVVRDVDELN
jgi:hypothetical protein